MKTDFSRLWSLKTKVSLFTLIIFMVSIWSLAFYTGKMLREDIKKLLHEQQFAAVSIIASDINTELDDRLKWLQKVATKITPATLHNPVSLQSTLEGRLAREIMFNGGVFVAGLDGTAIADAPLSTGRIGMNFSDRAWMIEALKGNATIGRPIVGKLLKVPVFSMAVPIRDNQGTVTGVLVGVVDLSKPNFLNRVTDNRYGKTGGYVLIAPQHKLVVTATDKSRVMQPIPAPGINPLMDRYLQGFEGSGSIVDSRGVEVLSSAKQIPAAGWVIVARIPVKEAFAPIDIMQSRMRLAAIMLTLFASGLTWWLLRQQLTPVFDTLKTLSALSDANLPATPLPITRQDEVGQLIGGFNRLLGALALREQALKASEVAIRKSEEKYRQLFQNMPAGFALHEIILDAESKPSDYRFLEINTAFEKLTGLKAADLIGRTQREVLPNSEPYWVETYGQVALTGTHTTIENFSRELNKYFQVSAYSPEQGKFATIFIDITDRVNSDKVMMESHERLLAVLNGLDAIVYVADMNSHELLFVNESLKGLFGNIAGQLCWETMQTGQSGPCPFCNNDTLLDEAGNPTGVSRWEYQNLNTGHWYDVRDRAIQWIDGRMVRLEIATDITERKRSEEEKLIREQELFHTQKLESLGVLAGGIAHDFNNILAIIMGYCSLIKMDYEDAEIHVPEIEKAADRAAGLCRQMLTYAGKTQFTQSQVNISMLIDEMVTMLRSTLPQNAEIKFDPAPGIPFVDGDASQLRQIVMNLIINASEAIGEAVGEIRVKLSKTILVEGHSDKDYHGITIPAGEYVCLDITDTGCGMDEETKRRIFEPFYTTKFTGRGLGMSAVLGIIAAHRGALQLFSMPGKGSTFKVYLPSKSTAVAADTFADIPAPWQGSGTILLVEDEEQIRLLARAMLQRLGFTVMEASNGREALELYQVHSANISLVITDMGMPVMDGYALFAALKRITPTLPVIISSGFGDSVVTARIAPGEIAGLVNKPYNLDQLRVVLEKVVMG